MTSHDPYRAHSTDAPVETGEAPPAPGPTDDQEARQAAVQALTGDAAPVLTMPPGMGVPETIAWMGEDQVRARVALQEEHKRRKPRKGVLGAARGIIASAD